MSARADDHHDGHNPQPRGPEPFVGSVFGFRWWRVGAGGELRSPWHGPHRWTARFGSASCFERRRLVPLRRAVSTHAAPERACGCGFYALWVPPTGLDGPWAWEVDVRTSGSAHGLLFGVVEAAGRVLLARDGFRAQFARPAALATGAGVPRSPDVDAVALTVPVRIYPSVGRLLALWSPAVGESRSLLHR